MTAVPVSFGRKRHADGPARALRVALVNMPYASTDRPSIQVALLKSVVDRAGHEGSTHHLNLDFVQALEGHFGDRTRELYKHLCEQRFAAGDWFFAPAAFGDEAPDAELMLDYWRNKKELPEENVDDVLHIREVLAPQWIDDTMSQVDWSSFDVIGFSSTFQQNVASFALARRIKADHPEVITLFGGANFDGEMGIEWVRSMPMVDYAITGEAEESLVAFLAALAADESPLGIPGVIGRRDGSVHVTAPEQVEDLNTSPLPDYDEYFDRLERLDLAHRLMVRVPFESARGCWWGAKRHCTFCGLNGDTMAFRAKTPERVLDELTQLALHHRVLRFTAVDNIIDRSYLTSLLPALADMGRPFHMFYETKADLSRQEVELFARSGIDTVQPGIESLSSHVLGLMKKGTKASWNVNVLRWLTYYKVSPLWNIIYGFPGEVEADIADQVDAIEAVAHIEPAGAISRVWLERFSPLFKDRDRYPAGFIAPNSRYGFVYPESVDLEEAAYFFDYQLENTLGEEAYEPLSDAFDAWQDAWADDEKRPTMTAEFLDDATIVIDHRRHGHPLRHELVGAVASVHDAIWERGLVPKQIAAATGLSAEIIENAVAELVERNIVFVDGNMYLALAIPAVEAPVIGTRSSYTLEDRPTEREFASMQMQL